MATPTSLTDTAHMRKFEALIIQMPPDVREKFIEDYLDWMLEMAWSMGTAPQKEKNAKLKELIEIFILGKKEPDQKLLEQIQEASTIMFYLIGDVGDEPPIVRLDRAQRRRVKLLNVWRAFLRLEPLPLPTLPGLEPAAAELPGLDAEASEVIESAEAEAIEEDESKG